MDGAYRLILVQTDEEIPDGFHRYVIVGTLITPWELPAPPDGHPLVVQSDDPLHVMELTGILASPLTHFESHEAVYRDESGDTESYSNDLRLQTATDLLRGLGDLILSPLRELVG